MYRNEPYIVSYLTAAECWEGALRAVVSRGVDMPTQYDKDGDPPSKELTLIMSCELQNINVHRCLPGGLDDLFSYVDSVVYGTEDHLINDAEGKWSYTYHQRLRKYPLVYSQDDRGPITVRGDQIQYVIDTLIEDPRSRRAQAIVWVPEEDMGHQHPACLQRLFFRLQDNRLHMNAHMRSNDAYKASMMNMYAFIMLQKYVAYKIGCITGKRIELGQYRHIVDSYHIYGKDLEDAKKSIEIMDKRINEHFNSGRPRPIYFNFYGEMELCEYIHEDPKWKCSRLVLMDL